MVGVAVVVDPRSFDGRVLVMPIALQSSMSPRD